MIPKVDGMKDLQDVMCVMRQIKNAVKDFSSDEPLAQKLESQFVSYEDNEVDISSECFFVENSPTVYENLKDIQDILKNSYQMAADPGIQSLIQEVLEATEQSLLDPGTGQHVEEFMQINNNILSGLGIPECVPQPNQAHNEIDPDFNEEELQSIYHDRAIYSISNPNCQCFTEESELFRKVYDLAMNFDYYALPKHPSGLSVPKLNLSILKGLYSAKMFYSHYKGMVYAVNQWLLRKKYAQSTELTQALLGSIQDQFEVIHDQCLKKHPSEIIRKQQQLHRADQAKFQAALQVHNINTPPDQNVGASYYFFRGYSHFQKGKISAYIKDVQNLTRHIQCYPDNLLELAKPYANLRRISEDIMQLYIKSIGQFLDYLRQDSPIKETTDKSFEFILDETLRMELKYPWKEALHYEKLAQVFQKCSIGLPGVNPVDRSDSQYHKIDGKIFKEAEFAVINGIDNELDDAMKLGQQLQEYTSGHRVHVLFNATQGKIPDLVEWLMIYTGNVLTPAVSLAIQFIRDHFSRHPNKKLFFISHSCGGAILKAALTEIPQKQRDLIVIHNMGGGAYIPLSLCKNAINFVSKNDGISSASHIVGQMYANPSQESFNLNDYRFMFLDPKPGSPLIDHTIQSPTYQDAISDAIAKFINKESGNENDE